MKVVYNTIVDDIDDIISQAKLENRTVKMIKLTSQEWRDYAITRGLTFEPIYYDRDGLPIDGDFLIDHKGVNLVLER